MTLFLAVLFIIVISYFTHVCILTIFHVSMYVSSGHSSIVTSVAFSPDGLQLASGSSDNSIKILNPETGDIIHTLQGKNNNKFAI